MTTHSVRLCCAPKLPLTINDTSEASRVRTDGQTLMWQDRSTGELFAQTLPFVP